MKALVTGSTGFLGSHLVEALSGAGHHVRALHRQTSRPDALAGLIYEPALGDLLDPPSLAAAMAEVDWVFHPAAVADYWKRGREVLYRVNVEGTRNVLSAALEAGVKRVVFTSSVGALGLGRTGRDPGAFIDETCSFDLPPKYFPYGHSKHLAEGVVAEFVARGLDAVIVNPAIILGPRDLNFISGSLIKEVYHRRVLFIPPGGSACVDAADVAAGHIAAAERGRTGERYILGAVNLSYREAFQIVAEVVGVRLRRPTLPRFLLRPIGLVVDLFNAVWSGPPLVDGNQVRLSGTHLYVDWSKAEGALHWRPVYSFRQMVERTFAWYRENGYL